MNERLVTVSEERRPDAQNVSFAISSRWKFDPNQLVQYRILVQAT